MARISIIIPVHNREALLSETLASVCAQTFGDWECIVVDDHSTDGSLSVARRYERKDRRFRVVSLPDPKRYGNAARNHGLSLAQGEFVTFLDSDDVIISTKLAKQLEVFKADPALDCVASRFAVFNQNALRDAFQVTFAPASNWLNAIWVPDHKAGRLWQTGCPLWRVDSVRRIGGWDEGIRLWQDCEFNVRALLRGLRIVRLEQIMVFVRWGDHHPRISKAPGSLPQLRNGLLAAWRLLEEANEVTELRRRLVAIRLYDIARDLMKDGRVTHVMQLWFTDCRSIGQKWLRTLYGAVLLIMGNYRWSRPVCRLIRPPFFRFVYDMPPAPNLVEMPLDELPKEQHGVHLRTASR